MRKETRQQYTFIGRLHRATWPKMEYDNQFSKLQNFVRRIRSFLDTPRCFCHQGFCMVHQPRRKI